MKKLQDLACIVVGSISGIGEGIAIKMAAEGTKVVVTGRRQERGDALVKKITDAGNVAALCQVDVTKTEEIADCDAFPAIKDASYITGQDIAVVALPVENNTLGCNNDSLQPFLAGRHL